MRRIVGLMVVASCVAGSSLTAQSAGEVHASYVHATVSKATSWGAGAQYQQTFGGKKAPVQLGTSIGLDWTKQDNGGPSQTSVSYDAALQPGGSGTITPYIGGSVGANWSMGSGKQWDGAKLGLETIGGLQFKLGLNGVSWKVEERYGYVRGQQDHTLTTRLGVIANF